MFLTILGDLAVFWLYVTLICFFTLHYNSLVQYQQFMVHGISI